MSTAPDSAAVRLRFHGTVIAVVMIALVTALIGAMWLRGQQGAGALTARAAEGEKAPPMVEGWPTPAFVLAITGQMHGYIEPCGCSPKQSGGLARRADLFQQLRDKKWSVVGLETGGTLDDQRVSRPQSDMKFAMILDSLNGMGYRSLGLGTEELKIGALKLFDIHSGRRVEKGFDMPFLAANVVLIDSPELETPSRYRIIEINGHKVGVTSVYGLNYRYKVSTLPEDEVKILDPSDVLPGTLADMKRDGAEYLVLMSYSDVDESRALAQKFTDFQLVVSAEGADDPGDEHEFIGQTLFFVSAMKGKYVNVIGVYPGEKPPVRFERVELDQDRFQRSPEIRKLMAKYQELLKEAWLDPNSTVRSGAFPHPSGRQFVGAETCKECHASAYEVWEGSNHFNATASLLDGRPEEKDWIDRTYDPECLACHATGWEAQTATLYADGFVDAKTTPHMAGNQCENCHSPASDHVKFETAWKKAGGAKNDSLTKAREELRVTKADAEKKVCLNCHDFANSPHFDFEKYWPQIEHPTPESEKGK